MNEWTADDLPAVFPVSYEPWAFDPGSRRDLAAWLNKHHPKPVLREDAALADHLGRQAVAIDELQLDLEAAEADRDRWRRAHEIVERERDQARDQWKKWEHKANEAEREVSTWRTSTESAHSDFLQAAHDRDEAVARAEAAEAQLADPYSQANQDSAAWDRVAAHPALRMDLLPDVEGSYADCVFERITQLAEVAEGVTEMKPAVAAEARTAPAVTRDDIEKAIRGKVCAANRDPNKAGFHRVHIAWATDSVWSLVSGADPAVHVVRESDVAAVEVEPYGDNWKADGRVHIVRTLPEARSDVQSDARVLARSLAVARAIEAGQAVDPVEELAGQIEAATRTAIRQACDDLATVAPSLDPLTVERAMEVAAASRKIAAHVLGQEAGDE